MNKKNKEIVKLLNFLQKSKHIDLKILKDEIKGFIRNYDCGVYAYTDNAKRLVDKWLNKHNKRGKKNYWNINHHDLVHINRYFKIKNCSKSFHEEHIETCEDLYRRIFDKKEDVEKVMSSMKIAYMIKKEELELNKKYPSHRTPNGLAIYKKCGIKLSKINPKLINYKRAIKMKLNH